MLAALLIPAGVMIHSYYWDFCLLIDIIFYIYNNLCKDSFQLCQCYEKIVTAAILC